MNGRFEIQMTKKLLAAVVAGGLLAGCAFEAPSLEGTTQELSGKTGAALDTSQQYASASKDHALYRPQVASTVDIYNEQLADSSVDEPNDPLETFNRFVFAINETLDVFVFKPLAATYRFLVPPVVRDSFRNFIRNVETPVVLMNDLLQGEMHRAEATAARFMINSIVGVVGFADVAADSGWDYHDEDFGQTLGTWGAGPGPYLVLPLLGPSNVRDGVGILVDKLFDPLTYLGFYFDEASDASLAMGVVGGIDFRSRNIETLEELQRDSVDFYARIRSVYLQRRVDEINNGEVRDNLPTPGLSQGKPEQVSVTD